ncbi:XylR family transcriptional regulator [Uliginosibacterium aquaticum]|uniref:DNA-binding transcriptional regulator n=1 Tax=Uliginosibacterium aquaticum TaxID=2731212 RepID=A0ABX2IQJ0_9RHOO|nr:DNA-binding transcriptional regulator [Uliginosibacterium aquaticum]NSL56513.1 DNA-binding transcriptional regulator [Uliginosibacterium aquaticum]
MSSLGFSSGPASSGLQSHRIALLFNANKVYDREIVAGIGAYLGSTRAAWELFMEEDFRCRPENMAGWQGDGIIADFDDPDIATALTGIQCPVVAVGSSYADPAHYPAGIPYVATDNRQLVRCAFEHLMGAGLPRFAMYSTPPTPRNRWAQEREQAFNELLAETGAEGSLFRGSTTEAQSWQGAQQQLIDWLQQLPKPIGIIAVNDARARHILQACLSAEIPVPEAVAIIGIDNDPLTRTLSRIPLSSVIQGTDQMGRTAAHLLHRLLRGGREHAAPVLVAPSGIHVAASSQHRPLSNPYVMRARHYIRQYAAQGIKAEQVVDHLGIARSTLDAYFRKELGYTVHDEIMHTKLGRAQDLLRDGQLSCSRIAVQCGFTSLQYMHAVFRRELGCTPREYQQNLREERVASN